jgi:hypothetical protein
MTERPETRNSGRAGIPHRVKGLGSRASTPARDQDAAGGRSSQPVDTNHQQRHADQGECDVVQDRPTFDLEHHRGHQAGGGGGAEHHEIVEGLRLAALGGPVGRRQQGRGANEQEVPADAVQPQRAAEVPFGGTHQRNRHAGDQEGDAGRHHVEHAETLDQVAGEESRQEHAHDVHEDGDRRLRLAQPALHDGEGRGRHHEGHHTEGNHRAGRRDHVGRLGHDLEQRPLRAA